MWHSIVVRSFVFGFLALVCLNMAASGQDQDVTPACKVNKPLIKVYAGPGQGDFLVVGRAGAITSTSPASVYISNINSGMRTEVFPADDYSFIVNIKATPGDKIRVNAQNTQGKKSYGSFDLTGEEVPFQQPVMANRQVIPAVKNYDLPSAAGDTTAKPTVQVQTTYTDDATINNGPASGTNIAVVLIVINTDTGDVISTSRISGRANVQAGNAKESFRVMIDWLISRCSEVIESEIFRPSPQASKPQAVQVSSDPNAATN